MLDWILRPEENDMRTLQTIRTPDDADRYNNRAAGIRFSPIANLSAKTLYLSMKAPSRLLIQGDWPAMPRLGDIRPQMWEELMRVYCDDRPAVLLYTRPESPARMAFSRILREQEVHDAGLLDTDDASLWLDGLMGEPGEGQESELSGLLELIACWYADGQGKMPSPDEVAQMLRNPAPLLSHCPPPRDGSADPLAVPYPQREALARRFHRLAEENPSVESGPSLCQFLRGGNSVSWCCDPSKAMTRALLCAQLKRLSREAVPFTLILDEPQGGWWSRLLRELGNNVRVLCRCDTVPGYPLPQDGRAGEAFSAAVSLFEAVVLGGVGQAASLWSDWFGSYYRAVVTENRSKGFHIGWRLFGPGSGFQGNRGVNAAWQLQRRLDEGTLRKLLERDGKSLLAGRDGAFVLYR